MTQLSGTVQGAPNKSLGFDSDTVISLEIAQQFASQGYHFCVRYLSKPDGFCKPVRNDSAILRIATTSKTRVHYP